MNAFVQYKKVEIVYKHSFSQALASVLEYISTTKFSKRKKLKMFRVRIFHHILLPKYLTIDNIYF